MLGKEAVGDRNLLLKSVCSEPSARQLRQRMAEAQMIDQVSRKWGWGRSARRVIARFTRLCQLSEVIIPLTKDIFQRRMLAVLLPRLSP